MMKKETVLFAPLNWGLGHAARIVPLIYRAINKGQKVIIAAEGAPLDFLKIEFPNEMFIYLPGFRIRYASKPYFLAYLLLQMPLFYASIWIEHFRLNKIIKQQGVSTVVSDNRYGLWSKKAECFLITHQVFIQLPRQIKFLEPILHSLTRGLIHPFKECWIPDYKDINLSLAGKLSHGKLMPDNVKYIGPLSRFGGFNYSQNPEALNKFDVLVLISGPEPQRTSFENEMEKRFAKSSERILMVCGKPEGNNLETKQVLKNITKVKHLSTSELYFHFKSVNQIVARCGYSTLMDLHALNLNGELIPTPGQTEQEYLALWRNSMK